MKFSRVFSGGLAAAALALGLVAVPATGAAALGSAARACQGGVVEGWTNSSGGSTFESSGNCGSVYVQVYYSHVGGATWTPVASSSTSVYRGASNTTQGRHWGTNTVVFST